MVYPLTIYREYRQVNMHLTSGKCSAVMILASRVLGGVMMRLALFTDTYLPETNGVAGTLHRLSNHLNRRRIEHLLFTPNSVIEGSHETQVRSVANIPFFCIPNAALLYPTEQTHTSNYKPFNPICCISLRLLIWGCLV